jgi:hypothetical protein
VIRRRRPALLLLLVLLSLVTASHGADLLAAATGVPPAPPAITPPEEVRAEFEAICRALSDGDDAAFGRQLLRQLRERLSTPIADPEEAIKVRRDLGRELFEQGEAEEAVSVLSEALKMAIEQELASVARLELMDHLVTARLRAATDANSFPRHTPADCLLPIAPEGVHTRPEHARKAGDMLIEILGMLDPNPRAMHAAWLLNLARMASGDYPEGVPAKYRLPAATFRQQAPFPAWRDRAPELGIDVFDAAGSAVMDDFDGDGLLDLISSSLTPCGKLKAFRNDGRGGFEDVTSAWDLDDQGGGLNFVHADYDNDGRLDLLLLRGAWMKKNGRFRNSLLRNEIGGPRGRFVDVSRSAGVGSTARPTQAAAWADYDGDGDLDLYVGNEATPEEPHHSELYRNNGDGTFTDVAGAAGVRNISYAKGVGWGDYDNDGDPDLYVSNMGPNRLYRNNGDGTFTNVASETGVIEPRARSFGTWFFDYDNDGDLDIFVIDYGARASLVSVSYFGTEVPYHQPLLYRNDGERFTEVSRQSGLKRPVLPMGANFGDLDNDGWLDVYLATGNPAYQTLVPNVMYRNLEGRSFADVTFAGDFGQLQKGHGVAFGDLDNDGDQDLFHQVGGMYPGDGYFNALFENPGSGNAWITLRLEGRKANRFGIGARIEVRAREAGAESGAEGKRRTIHLLAGSGGSFGNSSLQQEIGLGRARIIEEIVVRWPGSGTVQRFRDVEPGRIYRVVEGESRLQPVTLPRITLGGHSRPGK